MADLTEFLLARIAEDEVIAGEVEWWHGRDSESVHFDRLHVEVEAKRKLVELACEALAEHQIGTAKWLRVLDALALPYADHPDYRRVRPDVTKLHDLAARAAGRIVDSDNG